MCIYYLLLLFASAAATIIIDGSSSSVRCWCTCVRVILCSGRVTYSRDFFSSSTCYSYTTMTARIQIHNEEDLPICFTQAITSYTHIYIYIYKRASKTKIKIKKKLFSSFFFLFCCHLFVIISIFILLDLFYCMTKNRRMKNDHQEDINNEQQT